MRNLKKILALVLALVMSLALVTVANAEFKDQDKISSDYSEAVQVMAAIKVLEGDETTGNFNPDGTLTRAQAAKIITYMILGPDIAGTLSNTETPFSDVKASHWASGSVSYCYSQGIVKGMGDGTFNLSGRLTGYQFGKMLLEALGIDKGNYDADDTWKLNVAVALTNNGLLASLSNLKLGSPITRAQASQLAFNALQYSPNGSTSVYVVTDKNDNVLYRGTDALTALVMKQADEGNKLALQTTKTGSLADTVFGLSESKVEDDFGRSSKSWKQGNKDIVVLNSAPLKSYTTAVSYATLGKDLGYTSVTKEFTLNVSTNGGAASPSTVTRATSGSIGSTGTLTEVYKTGTDKYDVFVIETYVHELVASDIVKAKAATATTDAVPAYIKLNGNDTYVTNAFKAGDVVIYTKNTEKVVTAVKAPSMTGLVTATGTGYIRVNGTQYVSSKNATAIPTAPSATVYTFYMDSYNNLIYAKAGETDPEYETGYVYVIATAAKAAGSTGADGLFQAGSATAAQAQAKIIDLTTGEIKVVNQAITQNTNGEWFYAGPTGAATTTPVKTETAEEGAKGKIYTYTTLEDGSYVLIGEATTENIDIKAKSTSVATSKFANSATTVKFVELTKSGATIVSAKVTTYTGYNSFPTYAGAAVVATSTTTEGLVTSILYVADYEAPVDTTYAVYGGQGETILSNGQTVTLHTFFVDGEAVDYVYAGTALTEGKAYDITVSNGTVSKADEVSLTTGTVTYVDASMLVIGNNGTTIPFASNCVVVDANNDYALGEIAVGDSISYHTASNGAIDLVIINVAE